MSSIQFNLIRAIKALTPVSDSATLDAEVLLSTALNKERAYLRTWPELALTHEQLEIFNHYLKQRSQGTPLAYITGHREFWSRDFSVNTHVLIPRHDTELIIELSLKRIPRNTALKIIDLGTGSGIIAITLAAERPKLEVLASDIHAEALAIAKHNAKKHHVSRIQFYESNWFEDLPETHFDFIISNPPYIATDDPHLREGDLRFEPQTALVAAKQGLHDIEHIIDNARQHLNPQGYLIIEHGYNQKTQVKALFKQFKYQHVETFLDLSGNPRVTCGQWLNQIPTTATTDTHDMLSTPQEITIPRKLMQQLLHAAQETPEVEVCGLISAINHIPTLCYPIKNIATQPQARFQMDAKQQIATFTHMREQGETLFGIYHSHPAGPATPSKTDVQLTAYPEALHFIISLDTKGVLELRCFKITNALIQEIALNITD
ncbi:MAG: peptide chain release factor N(5)-glutamine methyltransferase [Methylococcales bacterium]